MQILKTIHDEKVLINYTSWNISPLLNGAQSQQKPREGDSPIERLGNLRRKWECSQLQ